MRASSTSRRTCPTSHVAYIENVPEGADSEQVFRSLARKGFDLIFGTSFGFMDPMETVAKEFPDITFVHVSGYKSNGKNFGNLFGAMEDMKYLAGMLAGCARQEGRQPEAGLHGHLPHPRRTAPGQRLHAGREEDLPECTHGRALDQHLARPGRRERRAASLFDAGAQVVLTGADTPAVGRCGAGQGQVGHHLRLCRLVQGRALPDHHVLELGPDLCQDRQGRHRQDLQARLRIL